MKKKTMFAIVFILLTAMGICTHLIMSNYPAQTAALMHKVLRYSAGLKLKTVKTSDGKYHYLEGGKGPVIIFLHGIYARKEHWIDITRRLTDSYRVILLDLPGFGENTILNASEYSYNIQFQRLSRLIDALNIRNFHIAANSMGGQIAAMLALEKTDQVRSIAFIGSPVGINSPKRSDMEIALANGINPLLVLDEEDYQKRMKWLFPVTPFIPDAIVKTWAIEEARLAKHNKRVWNEVWNSKSLPLGKIAGKISQPTLIIWCEKDRIFHVSGAKVLHSLLPNSKLQIFPECGHVPMLDRPRKTGNIYRNFLNQLR